MLSRRRVQSTFGIIKGRTGGHAVLSDESKRYVHSTKLFGRWATTFSHEWFGDKVAFTTATILRTQDACFNTTDDTEGIIMMIDTASKPTGGYYVIVKLDNDSMSFRTATNGPVVFTSSKKSWLPMAYADNKVLIQLSCVKGYQSAPRDVWDMAIQLGFANSRYTGPCFQGMSSHDVQSFVESATSTFLDLRTRL